MNIALTEAIDKATHIRKGEKLHKLTPCEKAVAKHLAINADGAGYCAFSPPKKITTATAFKLRTVRYALATLEEYGAVTKHGTKGGDKLNYSTYTLNRAAFGSWKGTDYPCTTRTGTSASGARVPVHQVHGTSTVKDTVKASVGSGASVPSPKLVEAGTSSHLVTDHTGENGKPKAKADKQAEKQRQKALLSELGAILREVDRPFGLLTPKNILEAWQCKGERLDASLLPAVVRKIMRETLWKRIEDPAKFLVGRVKLEAHTVWLNLPPPHLRAGKGN